MHSITPCDLQFSFKLGKDTYNRGASIHLDISKDSIDYLLAPSLALDPPAQKIGSHLLGRAKPRCRCPTGINV